MRHEDVTEIARNFDGIVVVDEAYIHFADARSFADELRRLPNVVVLQTLSKAWAMAGLRIGLALASELIIDLMNRVKPPYNVSGIAQQAALDALGDAEAMRGWVADTLRERTRLIEALGRLEFVLKVFPTDANFVLVRTADAKGIYDHLVREGVVVRDRSGVELCEGSLRITVGTPAENEKLLNALSRFREGSSETGR